MVKSQGGFSLVEVSVALAIASGLLVIALIGQRQVRSQATFTASVDKVIASIGDARNQATSGVDLNQAQVGTGTTNPCGVGVGYFGGISWVNDGASPSKLSRYTWVNSNRGGAITACLDATQTFDIGTIIPLNIRPAGQLLYVRKGGDFIVCLIPNARTAAGPDYANSTCRPTETSPIIFTITDADGHSARIQVDPKNGLAVRV